MIQDDINAASVILPDTLLRLPSSPYSFPLNYHLSLENQNIGAIFTCLRLSELYNSKLDPNTYNINRDYVSGYKITG